MLPEQQERAFRQPTQGDLGFALEQTPVPQAPTTNPVTDFVQGFHQSTNAQWDTQTTEVNQQFGDARLFGVIPTTLSGRNIATDNAEDAEKRGEQTLDAATFKSVYGYDLPKTLKRITVQDAEKLSEVYRNRSLIEANMAGEWYSPRTVGSFIGTMGASLFDPVNLGTGIASVALPQLALGRLATTALAGGKVAKGAQWLQTASQLRNLGVLPNVQGVLGVTALGATEGAIGGALTASQEASVSENVFNQEFDYVGYFLQNMAVGGALEATIAGGRAAFGALKKAPGIKQADWQAHTKSISDATGIPQDEAGELAFKAMQQKAAAIPDTEFVTLADDGVVTIHPDAQPFVTPEIKALGELPPAQRALRIEGMLQEVDALLKGADEFSGLDAAPINIEQVRSTLDAIYAFIPESELPAMQAAMAERHALLGKRAALLDARIQLMGREALQDTFNEINTVMTKQYSELFNATNGFKSFDKLFTQANLRLATFLETIGRFTAVSETLLKKGGDVPPDLVNRLSGRATKLYALVEEAKAAQKALKEAKTPEARAEAAKRLQKIGTSASRRFASWKKTLAEKTPLLEDVKAVFGKDSPLVERLVEAGVQATRFRSPEQIARGVRDSTEAFKYNVREMVVNNTIEGRALLPGDEAAPTAGVQTRLGLGGRGNPEFKAYAEYLKREQKPFGVQSMADYVAERSAKINADISRLTSLVDNADNMRLTPGTKAYMKEQLDYLQNNRGDAIMDIDGFTRAALDALDCIISGGDI
jgi:hypothetical protein